MPSEATVGSLYGLYTSPNFSIRAVCAIDTAGSAAPIKASDAATGNMLFVRFIVAPLGIFAHAAGQPALQVNGTACFAVDRQSSAPLPHRSGHLRRHGRSVRHREGRALRGGAMRSRAVQR